MMNDYPFKALLSPLYYFNYVFFLIIPNFIPPKNIKINFNTDIKNNRFI